MRTGEEAAEGDEGERGGRVVSRRGRLSEDGRLSLVLLLLRSPALASAVTGPVVVTDISPCASSPSPCPCASSPSPCPKKFSDCVTRSSMRSLCSCARASLWDSKGTAKENGGKDNICYQGGFL